MLCIKEVWMRPCVFVSGPTSIALVTALTVLTLFRKRVHSSAALLSLVLITDVSPPAALSLLIAAVVLAFGSWKGPLLITIMKFFWHPDAGGALYGCEPSVVPLMNASGSAFTFKLP